jgi:hypothetical protein
MALTETKRSFSLFECDFCGAVHANMDEAADTGCVKQALPDKRFKSGDEVLVPLDQDAEGHSRYIRARVRASFAPAKARSTGFDPKKPVKRLLAADGTNEAIGIEAPYRAHEWLVKLDPIDPAPHGFEMFHREGVLTTQAEIDAKAGAP